MTPQGILAMSAIDYRRFMSKEEIARMWMRSLGLDNRTYEDASASRLAGNGKRKVFFDIDCQEKLEAAGELMTELSGMPCEVRGVTVEETWHPFESVVADVTFNVGSLRKLPKHHKPRPTKVICNDPATIVFFDDGTKTVTKAHDGDAYDRVVGIAFCCLRKALRNRNFDRYEKPIRKLVKKACGRNPNGMAKELRAIANALSMTADALEVEDA